VLGLDNPILFENENGHIESGFGFLIGKDYQHHCQIEGKENALLLINIDPEHKDSQFWNATLLEEQPYVPIADPYLSTLQNMAKAVIKQDITITALSVYLQQFVVIEKELAIDFRIQQAIEVLKTDQLISLANLADTVCLSESRLVHLFKEQVGIPTRQYALWNRLLTAITKLGQYNLTEAAHAAGFTDSAHFSKTFSRMFGVSPSLLTKNSQFIQVSVSE
jgi:AraC-like DNA-binding protein